MNATAIMNAIMSISHNKTAIDIWFYLHTGGMLKDGVVEDFSIGDLANKLNTSRQSIWKALSLLEEKNIIVKRDGVRYYNQEIFG